MSRLPGVFLVFSLILLGSSVQSSAQNRNAWAWGEYGSGQLGNDTNLDIPAPVPVHGLTAVVAVPGIGYHSRAGADGVLTETFVLDCTGTITETVTLRAYLRRVADSAPVPGKVIAFGIDGTAVGSALTDSNGQADLDWIITAGPATRTIEASFAGDGVYAPSNGAATLTALSWLTKMVTFDRTARIGAQTELKCRLVRSDNVPVPDKDINFYVDGTFISTVPTDTQGYAREGYVVPDGAGAGARTILSEWAGDAGYAAASGTATLTVLKALAHIWVRPTSAYPGRVAPLYAYFRRLPDLQPQEGKTVSFSIDGTWIADATTGGAEPGIARYNYLTSGLSAGTYTLRCTYVGDSWVDAGSGEAPLTVLRATPHIWVMPRVIHEGKMARLYALFRRLPDLQPQEGKTVSFSIDGTWIADVVTGGNEPGVARYNFRTWGLPARTYTIRCDFAGDASLEPGFGQATLTILP